MRRTRSAFSLVELMVVVGIIGVLSSIAIPRMHQMSLKAKRAEAAANLYGMVTAETAYDAAYDAWIVTDVSHWPPGKSTYAWDRTVAGWDTLHYYPNGEVRCAYQVASPTTTSLTSYAWCDVDGDANIAQFQLTQYNDETPNVFEDLEPYYF